ncbi:ADP-ribosyltransferase [Biostraticola tofi]|nr:ADP-ribosyltransferase [Biostraticola tofi]
MLKSDLKQAELSNNNLFTPLINKISTLMPSLSESKEPELEEMIIKGSDLLTKADNLIQERRTIDNVRRPSGACLSRKQAVGLGLVALSMGSIAFFYNRRQQNDNTFGSIRGDVEEKVRFSSPSRGCQKKIDMYMPCTARDGDDAMELASSPNAQSFVLPKAIPSTEKNVPDAVKIEKIDFSCIEERHSLTLAQVFRRIGLTLKNPISELARESQVINYYHKFGRCPSESDINKLSLITSRIDAVILMVTSFIPNLNYTVVLQTMGGTLFQIISDDMEGNEVNLEMLNDFNVQIMFMAKAMTDFSSNSNWGKSNGRTRNVFQATTLEKGHFFSVIDNSRIELTYSDGYFWALKEGGRYKIIYDENKITWLFLKEVRPSKKINNIKFNVENGMTEIPSISKIKLRIDESALTALGKIIPLKYDDYLIGLPDEFGMSVLKNVITDIKILAIKIKGFYYRVTPGRIPRSWFLGKETEIALYDYVFYKRTTPHARVKYLTCRDRRAPGTPCIHLSANLDAILKSNEKYARSITGITSMRKYGIHPLYYIDILSNKGYIKYNEVYFEAVINKDSNGFHVYGKDSYCCSALQKKQKIAEIHYSPSRGLYYLNTPEEELIETLGLSREIAELHFFSLKNKPSGEAALTSDEIDTLYQYGRLQYDLVNEFMRDDMPELFIDPVTRDELAYHVDNIRSAMSKLTAFKGTVYRGAVMKKTRLDGLNVGDYVKDKALLSTSVDEVLARNYIGEEDLINQGVFYKIHISRSGFPIGIYTLKNYEGEVLIKDNISFKVLSINGNEIELEEFIDVEPHGVKSKNSI